MFHNVATLVRFGGRFNANFIVNFLTSQAVKELWKSANIWRSYRKNKKVRIFWDTVYIHHMKILFLCVPCSVNCGSLLIRTVYSYNCDQSYISHKWINKRWDCIPSLLSHTSFTECATLLRQHPSSNITRCTLSTAVTGHHYMACSLLFCKHCFLQRIYSTPVNGSLRNFNTWMRIGRE